MKTIHLVIDDKPIVAPEGTNIFQAAMDNDIYIPGLCYHPKLSQFGGCRLCMVEVTERRTGHRFACAHPISEGMVVKVNTPKVVRYRKSVMEFLLVHHELSCPTCDKAGECNLQDITHELNQSQSRFKAPRMNYPIVRDNPVLELNRNRCVLCGRCVSACKEIEGASAIDFQNRGIKTVIGTAFDKPLNCSFCGGCVAVCPTGAWQDRTLGFQGRSWEFNKSPTICPYCSVGCTIVLNTKMESVRRVTSDDYLGINEGNLCVKGRFGHEFIHSAERVKAPLVRKNGVLCHTSWEEALEYASRRFQEIIKESGGKAIGGIGSEKCTNEDNYLFQKFCRLVLGTNNIDNLANIRSPSLNAAILKSVTHGITSSSLKEIEQANTLFFVGVDVTEELPVIGSMARKAIRLHEAGLVIANMRGVTFHSMAKRDMRLKYSPGSQTILIQALMKIMVGEKLVDLKKIEASHSNYRDLYTSLDKFSIKEASQVTNVPEDVLRDTALLFSKAGNCCVVCGKDVAEDPLGEDSINALIDFCVLIQSIQGDATGGGKVSLYFSRHHNNSQGVNDMGVTPGFLPGYLDVNDTQHRETIKKSWGGDLPDGGDGNGSPGVFELAQGDKLKALYIMGENPIMSHPRGTAVREAFGKVGFIVVQDAFLTETAQLADVVFPSTTFAEKEGTFTNMGMTVQRLNKAIKPVGESRPDWQIITELAGKMGKPFPYASPKDILNEIEQVVPIYSGINYNRLKRKEFHWASSVANKDGIPKYIFSAPPKKLLDVKTNKDFPFLLLTGRSLNHQGTFSRHSKSLMLIAPECFVEVNRRDAQTLEIRDGDTVVLESVQNKIVLKAKVTNRSPEGVVFVPVDYEWTPVNLLCDRAYTPVKISKQLL